MTSIDEELRYVSDIRAQDEELRRLNQELDLKLDLADQAYCDSFLTPKNDENDNSIKKWSGSEPTIVVEDSKKNHSVISSIKGDYSVSDIEHHGEGAVVANNISTRNETFESETRSCATPDTRSSNTSKTRSSRVKNSDNVLSPTSMSSMSHGNDGEKITTASTTPNSSKEEQQPKMGTNATLRLYKAKIKTLTSQLKDAIDAKREAEESVSKLKTQLREETNENKKLQKALAGSKMTTQKQKEHEETTKCMVDDLKRQLNQTRRELVTAQKATKTAELEHKGREVRLSRALDECEKYKRTLAKAMSETREGGVEARKDRDKLLHQIKSLERQRAEILLAFKKQLKLIDVLKKQKVHAEAAKLLSFTEEEFVKVLDWGTC